MTPIPREAAFDSTLALLRAPYDFIAERARAHQSDVFEARILLRRTLCLVGPEAAALFYDPDRFRRAGAMPARLQLTLVGRGGVQTLDGDAHRARKAMLLALFTPARVAELVKAARDEWRRAVPQWSARGRVSLYEESQLVLTRAVCAWAGVPLEPHEAPRRRSQLVALFDAAGAVGPRHWRSRLARWQANRWIAGVVADVRAGRLAPPEESAASVVARHREHGALLPRRTVAVELLNVLRPTVAVSVWIVFLAHALHTQPRWRERLAQGDEEDARCFAEEVRRYYPFFPAVPARVRGDFAWRGYAFRGGTRALLDLHGTSRDERSWKEPELFRPERFRGRAPGPFDSIPQGGGDAHDGHRCAGEGVTLALMRAALGWLVRDTVYRVPTQDLRVDRTRVPALPRSGLLVESLRLRAR